MSDHGGSEAGGPADVGEPGDAGRAPDPVPAGDPSHAGTPGVAGRSGWGRWWMAVVAVVVVTVAAIVAAVVLASRTDPSGYDEATRERFLEACTADGGDAVAATCECLYDEIVEQVPFERFEEIDRQLAGTDAGAGVELSLPSDIQAPLQACRALDRPPGGRPAD